jgi:disulfide bond formation protein DsbB
MKKSDKIGPDPAEQGPEDRQAWMFVFGAWLLASMATLGALFFGEVMKLAPCSLCWYQRIFMFPLALILPFALFPLDRKIVRAVLPLVGIGWLVALLNVLVVEGIVPERVVPCRQGVPCSETVIEWFGVVTIPLLSFVAFGAIAVLLTFALTRSAK